MELLNATARPGAKATHTWPARAVKGFASLAGHPHERANAALIFRHESEAHKWRATLVKDHRHSLDRQVGQAAKAKRTLPGCAARASPLSPADPSQALPLEGCPQAGNTPVLR